MFIPGYVAAELIAVSYNHHVGEHARLLVQLSSVAAQVMMDIQTFCLLLIHVQLVSNSLSYGLYMENWLKIADLCMSDME